MMCQLLLPAGRARASETDKGKLTFTDDLRECRLCKVFLTAGALHYWEDSMAALLRATGDFPAHVLINRSPQNLKLE